MYRTERHQPETLDKKVSKIYYAEIMSELALPQVLSADISPKILRELAHADLQAQYPNNLILFSINNLLRRRIPEFSEPLLDDLSVADIAERMDYSLRFGHMIHICSSDTTIIQPGTYVDEEGTKYPAIVTPLFLSSQVFQNPVEVLQQYMATAYVLTEHVWLNPQVDYRVRKDSKEQALGDEMVFPAGVAGKLAQYQMAVQKGLTHLGYQTESPQPPHEPQLFW